LILEHITSTLNPWTAFLNCLSSISHSINQIMIISLCVFSTFFNLNQSGLSGPPATIKKCFEYFKHLWRACNLTSFSPCLTGPVDYLFASCHKGPRFKSPGRNLCETGILLSALSRYIGDPNMIDHHGLVWGGLRPKPSLGPRADNVMIPLDLTQLSCPGFTLAAGLPSGFTITESVAGGEHCGEPAISLYSHYVSLVQWTTCLLPVTSDPGSNPQWGTYVRPGFSC
jgi:hypothetical protein